jgi:hypothetical protein
MLVSENIFPKIPPVAKKLKEKNIENQSQQSVNDEYAMKRPYDHGC